MKSIWKFSIVLMLLLATPGLAGAVELISVSRNQLRIRGIDILDKTPLLDIKPYVPAFDAHPHSRAGWFDAATRDASGADGRFEASKS